MNNFNFIHIIFSLFDLFFSVIIVSANSTETHYLLLQAVICRALEATNESELSCVLFPKEMSGGGWRHLK